MVKISRHRDAVLCCGRTMTFRTTSLPPSSRRNIWKHSFSRSINIQWKILTHY